jgi:hypothetical protein
MFGRKAPIAGRAAHSLGRNSLELARATPINGREAHIHGRPAYKAARDHRIAGTDRRLSASNRLIRARVSLMAARVRRIPVSLTLNSSSIALKLGTINSIGDTVVSEFGRLGPNIVSITPIPGSSGRIPVTARRKPASPHLMFGTIRYAPSPSA